MPRDGAPEEAATDAARERWRRVQEVLDGALELPAADVAPYLAAACGSDLALRREVERLLASCREAEAFFEEPPSELAAAILDEAPIGERLGDAVRAALAGRYDVTREIARGGMAVVYLARDVRHGRDVAVKVLFPGLGAMLGAERFLRETEITARLSHPYILPLLDSGSAGGLLYYVMPYVAGESLRRRLEREGQLPVRDAVRIAREVADALGHAHTHGVVHRDVKPENVLLQGGHAVVADFGIARALDAARADRLTATGHSLGTPAYMSPEQAAGEPRLDGRADLYALGCVLYEMLAGTPPFTGPSAQAVLARHLIDPVPSIRAMRPQIPEELEWALDRLLAKAPADRFAAAAEAAAALEAVPLVAGGPRRGAPPRSASPPSGRRAPRRRRIALGVAVALTLAALGAAVWLGGRPGAAPHPAPATTAAVFPFAVSGPPDFAYLREGLVDVLSTKLDGVGDLHTIDPRVVLSVAAADASLDAARAAAGRLGAGLFVLGRVVVVGQRVQLTASLYELGGSAPLHRASAVGVPAALMELIDTVALRLVASQPRDAARRLQGTAALTTGSLEALRHYLNGERIHRSGENEFDLSDYRRAVETDSTFALAWYRLAVYSGWGALGSQGRAAVERAEALAGQLPLRDHEILAAYAAAQRGAIGDAEARYRAIVARYPDEVDAWFQLGELLFHHARFRARPLADGRVPFERALALDPTLQAPQRHLLEIAAREGDLARYDSLMERAGPQIARGRRYRALRAAITPGGPDRVARMDSALRPSGEAGPNSPVWVSRGLAFYGRDLAAAAAVAGENLRAATRPEQRAGALLLIADIEFARGRRRAARAALAELAPLVRQTAALRRAYHDVLPFVPVDRTALELHQATLRRLPAVDDDSPDAARPAVPDHLLDAPAHAQLRAYLLALIALRLGDTTAAGSHLRELEAAEGPPHARALGAELAHGVRGRLAAAAGGAADALAHLERARMEFPPDNLGVSPFFAQPLERFLRAELLRAVGRDEEALAWYATIADGSAPELAFLAPAALGRAAIFERRGDRARAAGERARAAAFWRDCDPELRAALAAGGGRPGAAGRAPVAAAR